MYSNITSMSDGHVHISLQTRGHVVVFMWTCLYTDHASWFSFSSAMSSVLCFRVSAELLVMSAGMSSGLLGAKHLKAEAFPWDVRAHGTAPHKTETSCLTIN